MQKFKTLAANTPKPLVNFDGWASLAQTDPEAFEAKRAEAIEATISKMPAHKQERMRRLQWKIDQVRRQADNPMAACIKLSEMMWDSLVGPGGLKDALEQTDPTHAKPLPQARVLEFPTQR